MHSHTSLLMRLSCAFKYGRTWMHTYLYDVTPSLIWSKFRTIQCTTHMIHIDTILSIQQNKERNCKLNAVCARWILSNSDDWIRNWVKSSKLNWYHLHLSASNGWRTAHADEGENNNRKKRFIEFLFHNNLVGQLSGHLNGNAAIAFLLQWSYNEWLDLASIDDILLEDNGHMLPWSVKSIAIRRAIYSMCAKCDSFNLQLDCWYGLHFYSACYAFN